MSGPPQLPEDPSPMPTMGSDDEESFVLLCNSYVPELDLSFKDLHIEPVQSGPIEEGKELISMELSQLENSSLPKIPDVTQQMMKDSDSNLSKTSKILSGMSPEAVSEMVLDIGCENLRLKRTLTANYEAMETQYNKIMAWKEEVYRTYQAHKDRFAEAKDFIAKLKSEKNILTFELEKSKEIRGMEQAELLRLKAELAEKVYSLSSCDTVDSSLNKDIQDQVPVTTANLYKDMNKKLDDCEEWLRLSDERDARLNAENEELKEKILSLENNEETVAELEEEIEHKDEIIEMLERKVIENEELSALEIKDLHGQIIELETQLSNAAHLQEDVDNLRKQLMNAQASITDLHQINEGLVLLLNDEQKRVKELTELESIRDDYLALQQQLEVYKADFDTERKAKNILQSEKEQIIEDFLQLQKRNNELNDELAVMRENGFVLTETESSYQQSTSKASSAKPQQSPPLSMFTCPVCNLKHRSLKLLEDHVETCIPDPDWL